MARISGAQAMARAMCMRYLLQDQPAAPPSRIAAATGLQRTNLSTVLRGPEQKGLVERHSHPEDGRGVMVHPTKRGERNYTIVCHEWADALSADNDTTNLDAALTLLAAAKEGLVNTRPQ